MTHELIQVFLSRDLIEALLRGLYKGASRKKLRAIIDINKHCHVESRGLRMVIEGDENNKIKNIRIHHEKLFAQITAADFRELHLNELADNVVATFHEKYSPVVHSLADNIVVFEKVYGDLD